MSEANEVLPPWEGVGEWKFPVEEGLSAGRQEWENRGSPVGVFEEARCTQEFLEQSLMMYNRRVSNSADMV